MAETSKTVDQALTVLLKLSDDGPLTAAQLSRELGLNRTVVQRLLTTLQLRGFVTRSDQGYGPGARLVRIAERVQPELRAAAAGIMRELGRDVGETVVMHIADGHEAVVLQQYVPTSHVVRVEHEIGSRHPLTRGASGRALLAFMSPATVERAIRGDPQGEALRRELDGVRHLGYAFSHDELQHGVHGLAVPVPDHSNHAFASLAIIVPSGRAAGLSEHIDVLLGAAAQVARALLGEAPTADNGDRLPVASRHN
jgi:DNA-binding IclR family transcriptional regulator